MITETNHANLVQRTGLALAAALRQLRTDETVPVDGQVHHASDLLVEGLNGDQLPDSIDRTRLRSAHSAAALALNSFLPWREAIDQLPLGDWVGFDAIQFEVRCPTGLRGTPPHLDLMALREGVAVAVTVRCTEYLARRKSQVAPSYDRLLASTPALGPWFEQLQRLRAAPGNYRHVDLGALIKHALALGRTFPDRATTLVYLYWEPVDADQFVEFRRHRAELSALASAVRDAGVTFSSQSFDELWRAWSTHAAPAWLADHLIQLRARYRVAIADGGADT